ncbi:MAG: hypothetical protein HY800_10280, partial [Ignavibacteriales bacterium]|nr:hypothetical protein [Ignavibacteriales bacterium]
LWNLSLYKDSVSQTSLISSVASNTSLTVTDLNPGTYIAIEADSTGWQQLGKIINGEQFISTTRVDTFTLATGQSRTIDFVNCRPKIIIRKFVDSDGLFSTTGDRNFKTWSISLYKDTVTSNNLISQCTSCESLVVFNPPFDTYIALEADSVGWQHIGKVVDGVPIASSTRTDTFVYSSGQIKTIDFVNFNPNKIIIRKLYDSDGLLSTTQDRSIKRWSLRLYKETMSNLIASVSASESLLVENLGNGTYIVVEGDSLGWVNIGKIRNGVVFAGQFAAYTFTVTGGQTFTVDFINTAPHVSITKFKDLDGNFNTSGDRMPVPWSLTLYRGSVAPTNIVVSVASSESLVISGLPPDNYIVREADSVGWLHIGTVLNGVGAASQEREVQFSIAGVESHEIEFINTSTNFITIRKLVDQDGNFATVGDRTLKNWRLSLHKDTITGTIVGSVASSPILTVSNLMPGKYVAVEADSSRWSHISTVVDGISQGGTSVRSWMVNVVSTESHTVDFVNFDLDRKKVWTAAIDCEWNNGSNWEPAGIPIPGDTIIVASSASCPLVIPPDAALGTISIAVGETLQVRSGTSLLIGGNAIIDGAFIVEAGGDPTITIGGDWKVNGKFTPEYSTIIFEANRPQVIDGSEFYNVQIGSGEVQNQIQKSSIDLRIVMNEQANVKTNGDWMIEGVLNLNTNLDAETDTVFINNPSDTALHGNGIVISGSINRAIQQGSLGVYQFESENSFIQFDGTGTYPNRLLMTVFADTTPSSFSSKWFIVPSIVDTNVNTLTADSLTGFSFWSFGYQADTGITPMGRRVYSIGAINGNNFKARLALRYNQADIPMNVSEESIVMLTTKDVVSVDYEGQELPRKFALEQNHPNPFNPSTVISYQLPVESSVRLRIYDILGREVQTLVDGIQDAGFKSMVWNASDLSSSIYFYRLDAVSIHIPAKTFTKVRKMILIR